MAPLLVCWTKVPSSNVMIKVLSAFNKGHPVLWLRLPRICILLACSWLEFVRLRCLRPAISYDAVLLSLSLSTLKIQFLMRFHDAAIAATRIGKRCQVHTGAKWHFLKSLDIQHAKSSLDKIENSFSETFAEWKIRGSKYILLEILDWRP